MPDGPNPDGLAFFNLTKSIIMKTSTEVTIIDPKEYGIEEKKAHEIELAFKPKITEREELFKMYSEIIKEELTGELGARAKELRLKIVKARTGLVAIHKTQKEYSLAMGRFCDAIKNKEVLPCEQMEEKLSEIENHFENIEKEKITALAKERTELLKPYLDDFMGLDLGNMPLEVFEGFLERKQKQHADKLAAELEAEKQHQENLRLDRVASERRIQLAPYIQFNKDNRDLRLMADEDYKTLLSDLEMAKYGYEQEQKRIADENAKLKSEAEAKEARLAKERKEANAKFLAEQQKARELQAKIDADNKQKADEQKAKETAEKQAQAVAAKLAKAPVKKQLVEWVNSFETPTTTVKNETSELILEKFEAFKNWAFSEIGKL